MFAELEEEKRKTGGGRMFTWRSVPLPLKFFLVFAAVSYGIQMYLTYTPPASHPAPGSTASFVLAWTVCPVCIFTPTVDPTPSSMAHFIGPIDALIHGMIGAVIGYVIEAFL
jgi:hypothetical protein